MPFCVASRSAGTRAPIAPCSPRCRAFVLENCDQSKYINSLASLYRELIEEKMEVC